MRVEKDVFFRKIDGFKHIPIHQSRGYFNMKFRDMRKYYFYLDDNDNPTVGCYGVKVEHLFMGSILFINSIAFKTYESNNLSKLLDCIIQDEMWSIVDITDDNLYSPINEKIFRECGFRRPIGQWGSNLTIMVGLEDIVPFNNDWKKNIKAAQKNENLNFKRVENRKEDMIEQISTLFKENSEEKHLSYLYTRRDLEHLLNDEKNSLYIVSLNDKIVAARVVFVNKNHSIDFCTANGKASREIRGVTQYLCSNIFEDLKRRGVTSFDFSRTPIGRKGAEGVCLFKSGSRGKLTQYNGHWQYVRKEYYRYLMFLINKIVQKKYEY